MREENSAFTQPNFLIYKMRILLRPSPTLKFTNTSKTKLTSSGNGREDLLGSRGSASSPVLFPVVNPVIINQGQFCPVPPPYQGTFDSVWNQFDCHDQKQKGSCYWAEEARDAAPHPAVHRTGPGPAARNYPAQMQKA